VGGEIRGSSFQNNWKFVSEWQGESSLGQPKWVFLTCWCKRSLREELVRSGTISTLKQVATARVSIKSLEVH